ncbi:MAG: TadE/TadG family type IV pilus assembly protein, partial [Planctomycetia bacterium]
MMRLRGVHGSRRGILAPLFAVLLIPMMGLLALSIDVGMMMNARTECQDVADMCALVGSRSINSDSRETKVVETVGKMFAAAVPEMHRVKVLSKPLTVADNITMEVGTYRYVTSGVPRPEFRGFTTL